MRKTIGGLAALLAVAAATVAVSVAQASGSAAAASSPAVSPYCFGQTPFSPVAALKASGDVRRDRVPNQYKLEQTADGSPSPFAPLATINVTVYFHVIRSA